MEEKDETSGCVSVGGFQLEMAGGDTHGPLLKAKDAAKGWGEGVTHGSLVIAMLHED